MRLPYRSHSHFSLHPNLQPLPHNRIAVLYLFPFVSYHKTHSGSPSSPSRSRQNNDELSSKPRGFSEHHRHCR